MSQPLVDDVFNQFTSTVFQCDTTKDARYIRCDFKRCSKHSTITSTNKVPTDFWIRNTEKNVKILERHVSNEVFSFIETLEADEEELNLSVDYSWKKEKYEHNTHILDDIKQLMGCDKVLVVFNLRDPQSAFGKWIDLFLNAVKHEEGLDETFCCITLSFSSRKELLEQICKLQTLTLISRKLEVSVVLSCHSSSQGQVFSCTPAVISKLYQFEEFCSVHDFVCTCQFVLKQNLKWIHFSSCFAMKMNESHKFWPVDYSWYQEELRCLLTGSAKEVYETGSQTADLFLILNTILDKKPVIAQFHSIFKQASMDFFPDLVLEMGLTTIDSKTSSAMLENPEKEVSVTKPSVISSSIHLVIIYSKDNYTNVLKDAIIQNLSNRNSSDVKLSISLINIKLNDNPLEQLLTAFNDLISINLRIFFIVLDYFLDPLLFMKTLSLCHQRCVFEVYGVHFNKLDEKDLKLLQSNCSFSDLTVIGFLEKVTFSSKYSSPVLLYIIHLSIGENGYVLCSKKSSSWLLEDVYHEVNHVLPGLCEKCGFFYLSNSSISSSSSTISNMKIQDLVFTSDSQDLNSKSNQNAETENGSSLMTTMHTKREHHDEHISDTKRISIGGFDNSVSNSSVHKNGFISEYTNCDERKKRNIATLHLGKSETSPCKKSPKKDLRYPCNSCHRSFHSQETLNSHLNNHKSYRYTCKMCGQLYSKKRVLHSHMHKEHGEACETVCGKVNDCYPKKMVLKEVKRPNERLKRSTHDCQIIKITRMFDIDNDDNCDDDKSTKRKRNQFAEKDYVQKKAEPLATSLENDSLIVQAPSTSKSPIIGEHSSDDKIDFNIIYKPHSDEASVKYSQETGMSEEESVVQKCTIKDLQIHCDKKKVKKGKEKLKLDDSMESFTNEDNKTKVEVAMISKDPVGTDIKTQGRRVDDQSLMERDCLDTESLNKDTKLEKIKDTKYHNSTKCEFKGDVIDHKNDDQHKNTENDDFSQLDDLTKDMKDVPLMANVDEVLVYHYKLELDVHFKEKSIDGDICLFVKPTNEKVAEKEFQMCLDCTLIDIKSVYEITLPDNFDIHFHNRSSSRHKDIKPLHCDTQNENFCQSCSFLQNYKNYVSEGLKYKTLSYAVHGWCIRVWKENSNQWPKCVYIKYRTKPIGPSLMWCKDSDGAPCAFTPGAYINNRSMMPCQEPPVAMATWQASIQVPEGYVVLSSGDKVDEEKAFGVNASNKYFFEMSLPLPSSTLAFAFGKFVRSSKVVPVLCSPNTNVVTVSLYASASKIERFEEEYLELSVKYLKSACNILGKYPFTRVDLVLMPRSFACLGLESPNLTFLSQSILCGDQSMSTRIAHEISHAWFGLLVGAEDWTEEWLSEGFATYIEDRILAHGLNLTDDQFVEYSYLMQILRYKTLKAEIDATEDDNLKRLRPIRKQSKSVADAINESLNEDSCNTPPVHIMVPNAAVASKKWSQVHYLKGYFLLQRMAKMVGLESFDAFLRYYLEVHAGRLVTSEMFFNLFIEYYSLSSTVKDEILNQWMESTTVPIFEEQSPTTNSLVLLVQEETKFWKSTNATNKRLRTLGIKRKAKQDTFKKRPFLNSNQLVLLLENLLLVEDFFHQTLTQINKVYRFSERNSEVRHRWCELIIKHLYYLRYDDVRRFLIEDQGMGIYLFAELIITNNPKQRDLAVSVFEMIKDEMDRSTYTTVNEILCGTDE